MAIFSIRMERQKGINSFFILLSYSCSGKISIYFSLCSTLITYHSRDISMKFTKNLGMLLLSIWLIVSGLAGIIPALYFNGLGTLLAILAIAAGVFILLDRRID
jgi:hypothetical protein